MSLRSGRKNKLSRIKQLFALETLQIAPKPGQETKPQPLHYTLNTKVARAGRSIASQLCLQADGLVHSFYLILSLSGFTQYHSIITLCVKLPGPACHSGDSPAD